MSKYRTKVKLVKDKKVFKHTADKTKRVNVAPSVMRGGIRM